MVTGAPSLRSQIGRRREAVVLSEHVSAQIIITFSGDRLFQVNPRDRPSATTVLQHPLLEKHISRHVGSQVITGRIQVLHMSSC